MKTILVATDFSPASERAAEYAIQLAQPMEAGLLLCHVMSTPIVTEPQALELSTAMAAAYDSRSAQKELHDMAERLIGWQRRLTGRKIPVDTLTLQGDVAAEVIELADERQASLVVVGTHDEADTLSIFSGNHTSAMLEHCRLPVMVVPEKAHFREIRKLLFACDWQETDMEHLQWLSEFAGYWDASVLVVHVTTDKTDLAEEMERMNRFINELPSEIVSGNFSFRVICADSVAEELDHLIRTESVDLLTMATKKRNLFQQLVHRSLTKRMAGETEIPLLAFHANRLADIWLI
jgi:nucleotide-binding universal stress UspA family protein